jgi:hypothetical protein
MNGATSSNYEISPLSTSAFALELSKTGLKVVPGATGTFWLECDSLAMVRLPYFCVVAPEQGELASLLWTARAAVANYIVEPDKLHPANAWLYVSQASSYSVERLSKAARRDLRRAQRKLRIDFIEWSTLLNHGFPAFSQTFERNGLRYGTFEHFRRGVELCSGNAGRHVIGAWKDDVLVAFMRFMVVDDWVQIEGCCSTNDDRGLCPNDGLVHHLLNYFLVQRRFQLACYGLSSVKLGEGEAGLHTFKKKVGFEAIPVHRTFILHPLIRPFANRLTLRILNTAVRFRSIADRVKKAHGLLACFLGEKQLADTDNDAKA